MKRPVGNIVFRIKHLQIHQGGLIMGVIVVSVCFTVVALCFFGVTVVAKK